VKAPSAGKVLDHRQVIESGAHKLLRSAASNHRGRRSGAGDIVAIRRTCELHRAMTICDPAVETPLPRSRSIRRRCHTFRVNDSPPPAPKHQSTGRMIRDRLLREAKACGATRRDPTTRTPWSRRRGELQLGILIETMRREGFELSVSRPKVLLRDNDKGETEEPIEEVVSRRRDSLRIVVQKMSERKAE